MNCQTHFYFGQDPRQVTRRWFFRQCGVGLGAIALGELLRQSGIAAAPSLTLPVRSPHHTPRAKRVVFLFMAGAPSHLELFDNKPILNRLDGEPIPETYLRDRRFAFMSTFTNPRLLAARRRFARHGQSGAEISELLPHLGSIADDVAILKAVQTEVFNHGPAKLFINTGSAQFGRPSMGSWVTYGLGSEANDLPGFVVLQELKILEHFDVAAMGLGSADLLHTMVEAKKLAFADRERWGADLRSLDPPFARLLSAEYTAELAAHIDMHHAAPTGSVQDAAAGDTTYFCTADGDGNAVSGIQSINSGWGSGVTAGETGILLNNRMAYWHLDPAHPNHLRPGRRVRHTMNPPLVLKDGALWCVFGTPGADNQVQDNLQVLTAMIDFGLDPQQAAEMPRWTSNVPGQYANWPHDGEDALTIERRFPDTVRAELARRGHPIKTVGDLEGPCSVEIIRRDPATGMLLAGSDPRRDGWALAW